MYLAIVIFLFIVIVIGLAIYINDRVGTDAEY